MAGDRRTESEKMPRRLRGLDAGERRVAPPDYVPGVATEFPEFPEGGDAQVALAERLKRGYAGRVLRTSVAEDAKRRV